MSPNLGERGDSNLIEREFENNFATKLELEQRSLFVVVSFFKEIFLVISSQKWKIEKVFLELDKICICTSRL